MLSHHFQYTHITVGIKIHGVVFSSRWSHSNALDFLVFEATYHHVLRAMLHFKKGDIRLEGLRHARIPMDGDYSVFYNELHFLM